MLSSNGNSFTQNMNIFTGLGLLGAILLLINKPLRNKYKTRLLERFYKSTQVEFCNQMKKKSPGGTIEMVKLCILVLFIGLMLWGSAFYTLTGINDKSVMKPALVLLVIFLCIRTEEKYQEVKQFLVKSYKSIIGVTYSVMGVALFAILIGFCAAKDTTPIVLLNEAADLDVGIGSFLIIAIVPFVVFTAFAGVLYIGNYTCYKLSYYSAVQLSSMVEIALAEYEYPFDSFRDYIKEKKYWLTLLSVAAFFLYYLIFSK
ncbi:MAG: hypothetical protein JKX76_03870 [Colwellia sp.]|nr:hypothetical protein [Colwellia sp.]